MPKSRSKRRRYQPPPAPRPKPSPPWYGPTIAILAFVGLAWLLVFYMEALPEPLMNWGNYNLLIGFVPFLAALLLATRWQ